MFRSCIRRCYAIAGGERLECELFDTHPFFLAGLLDDLTDEDKCKMAAIGQFHRQ